MFSRAGSQIVQCSKVLSAKRSTFLANLVGGSRLPLANIGKRNQDDPFLYTTLNPAKISLFLEEAGLPYQVVPIDTSKGEQHLPALRKINPNGKVPAIVDTDGPGGKERVCSIQVRSSFT